MATKLYPVRTIPNYAVIIRCEYCRGAEQDEVLVELARRGLWLSGDQQLTAGLDSTQETWAEFMPQRGGGQLLVQPRHSAVLQQ